MLIYEMKRGYLSTLVAVWWLSQCFPKLSSMICLWAPTLQSGYRLMLKSQTCLFLWTVWIWAHGLPACMWLRWKKKKKRDTKPSKMQICIIWLQPREGWCNISVTEHSRSNIFRLISVSKRNSSLITFVKICFKHLHLKDLFIYFK